MRTDRTLWQWWEVCLLALVVWREARGAGKDAQIAVACSIRNRVDRPKWWGTSYDQVITKKWQYSSVAATGDPQLIVYPQPADNIFDDCLSIASDTYDRVLSNPMPGADSYHDTSIPAPKWATDDCFVGQIGTLRFFNVDHDVETVQ